MAEARKDHIWAPSYFGSVILGRSKVFGVAISRCVRSSVVAADPIFILDGSTRRGGIRLRAAPEEVLSRRG